MLADVLHHAVRHQIPDRLVVFGAAASTSVEEMAKAGIQTFSTFPSGKVTPSGLE